MGSPCPSNLSSWTDPTVNTTVKIKIEHLNELRSAINREQNRRSLQSSFSDPNISHTTNKINIGELKSIRDGINSIGTVSWNVDFDSITTSNKFETNHLIELRNQINNFEAQCLCDCDYSPCSCDGNCNSQFNGTCRRVTDKYGFTCGSYCDYDRGDDYNWGSGHGTFCFCYANYDCACDSNVTFNSFYNCLTCQSDSLYDDTCSCHAECSCDSNYNECCGCGD